MPIAELIAEELPDSLGRLDEAPFQVAGQTCTIGPMSEEEDEASVMGDLATPLESGLKYDKTSAHPEAQFSRQAVRELQDQLRRIDEAQAQAYSESGETYVT